MWLGTAVVATRYSGVLDFLDDTCAAMVDAELVPVRNGVGIYPETARWADPDLEQAAAHIRRLVDDPTYRAELIARGLRRIADQPSPSSFGEGYAAILRTDPAEKVLAEPFFDGLDATCGRFERWRRAFDRRVGSDRVAWPDSARRPSR